MLVVDTPGPGDSGPADEEGSAGAGEVGIGFGKGEGGAVVGDEENEGVSGVAGFFEGIKNAANGVIESTNGIIVVREFESNSRKVGEVRWDGDFFGAEKSGWFFDILLWFLRIVKRAMWIMGVDHEVEGLSFFLTAVEEFDGVVMVFFRRTAGAQVFIIVSEVPGEARVAGRVTDFSKNAGEVAVFLKGGENGGNVLGEFVEAVASGIVAIAAGGDDGPAGSADCDVHVGALEAQAFFCQLTQIWGHSGETSSEKIHRFIAKVVSGDEKDVERLFLGPSGGQGECEDGEERFHFAGGGLTGFSKFEVLFAIFVLSDIDDEAAFSRDDMLPGFGLHVGNDDQGIFLGCFVDGGD
jgi:hypothetical protein